MTRKKPTKSKTTKKLSNKKDVVPKRLVARRLEPVDPKQVRLVEGKGGPERGAGRGGHYWHIHSGEKRVGYVFINVIKDEILGEHPSVQIHLNQSERGKQIGRIAYQSACEQSGHDNVYAHMRKSNIGSRRAAEEAGFKAVEDKRISQLSMVWQRKTQKT